MGIRSSAIVLAASVFVAVGGSSPAASQDGSEAGVSVKSFEQMSDEAFRLTMIQPGRRVLQLMEFDAPLPRGRVKELFSLYETLAQKHRSKGRARYWDAAFCGFGVDRLYVTIEYPDVRELAQSWERMNADPAYEAWEQDARSAGLLLKSRRFLDNIGGPSLADSASPKDAPPHVMQIMEMDIGADASVLLKLEEQMARLNRKYGVNRIQRDYQVNWAGERRRGQMTMVEYDGIDAMMQANLLIDNASETRALLRSGELGNVTRLSECVTTEIR